MTTFRVRVDLCRFPLHGLDLAHVFPPPDSPVEAGPIVVSRLDNGEWFVQDGRHRVIRARLNAREWIDAVNHDHQIPPYDLLYGYAPGQTPPPDHTQVELARALLDGRGPQGLITKPIPVKALDIAREIVHRGNHPNSLHTPC